LPNFIVTVTHLPHIGVFLLFFTPIYFEASKLNKYPIYVPNTVVCSRHVIKKWSLNRLRLLPKRYINGVSEGVCFILFGGLKGAIASISSIIFWTWEGLKWPQVNVRVTCKNAEKILTLSQSIEKLQHFEINLMDKTMQNTNIGNFETPSVDIVTANSRLSMCYKGSDKVNICAKFDQYWSMFYRFIAVWSCKRRLFNENNIFSQYAHVVKC
jgi:hypothetical protein